MAVVGPHPPVYHHQTDIRDRGKLRAIFEGYKLRDGCTAIRHVIHFAALKSVEGSRLNPAGYYSTNVLGTSGLLEVMKSTGVNSLVFSSSAVVYGSRVSPGSNDSSTELLAESCCPVRARQPESERQANYERITNTYGKTKLMCEELIHKLCYAHGQQSNKPGDNFRAVILRYTNPSGNDPSGQIGDSPTHPENLMPIAAQVLQGTREKISIYGTDYPTRDGTGKLFLSIYGARFSLAEDVNPSLMAGEFYGNQVCEISYMFKIWRKVTLRLLTRSSRME
jgi:UDP-glucose 4-epimerase